MRFQSKFLSIFLLALTFTASFAEEVNIKVDVDTSFSVANRAYIRTGLPNLPAEFQANQVDVYVLYTLQLGAQFIAAQAVVEELFTSSVATVTKVHQSTESNPSEFPTDQPEGDISLVGYQYYFDIEMISANSEAIRAQFVVLMNKYTYSFEVSWFKFDYLVSLDGTVHEVELGYSQDNFEYNMYDWDITSEEGTAMNDENILVVDELPEMGESFNYDPNLPINKWTEVNVSERVDNRDFVYLLRYGTEFSINQVFRNGNYSIQPASEWNVTEIYSVYERNTTNQVDFKFNVEAFSTGNQTLKINFQLWYNPGTSSLSFYSWSMEGIEDKILDF